MIHLVNFSDERMTKSQELCSASSLKYGVNKVHAFRPVNIYPYFRKVNPVLKEERGAGYWLWKPFFIYEVIRELDEGDVLIYSDSGVEFINDVNHLINAMDQDILFFSNGHYHKHWCKADVIVNINGFSFRDTEDQQVQASVIVFKVNQNTKDFVKEWLLWCQMPGFIDDNPSKLPNHPEFAEHRHDQAILTCLQIKYGYKLHWWADGLWYMGMKSKYSDNYPAIFKHHRKRDNEW